MIDESKDYESEEIAEEDLEQVSGGAMVVRPNLNPGLNPSLGKDGDCMGLDNSGSALGLGNE